MNSKKKKLPLKKKLSLIACSEIKSARNTQEKSQSYWGRYFEIILWRNWAKYHRLDLKNHRKEILYYDSYHAENLNILEKIFTSLDLENVAAFGVELYRPDWKLNCVMNTSLQINGEDCDCHALIIAENISRRCLNFDFQTKEIIRYREKIAYEIIAGNLFEQKLCADFWGKSTVLDK